MRRVWVDLCRICLPAVRERSCSKNIVFKVYLKKETTGKFQAVNNFKIECSNIASFSNLRSWCCFAPCNASPQTRLVLYVLQSVHKEIKQLAKYSLLVSVHNVHDLQKIMFILESGIFTRNTIHATFFSFPNWTSFPITIGFDQIILTKFSF
jgi:hypothetical protein